MKKVWVIAGVVLLFLCILGAILYKAFDTGTTGIVPTYEPPQLPSAAATSVDRGPEEVATTCFKWYVEAYMSEANFEDPDGFVAGVERCFTPAFTSTWEDIVINTEADPVLLGQDYFDSWATAQRASNTTVSGATANTVMSLGTNEELVQFNVTLIQTASGWRISNVTHR